MSNYRLPPLNWLRVFESAATLVSFSGAAKELNVSKSAVSQQIRALESRLGQELFERLPHEVKLTAHGEALLPDVKMALVNLDTTIDRLFPPKGSESITVQSNTIFAASWLSPRLPRFQKENPDLRISLVCCDDNSDYLPNSADVWISFSTELSALGSVHQLFSERVFPIAIPDIAQRVKTTQDICDHMLIEVPTHQISWRKYLSTTGVDADRPLRFCNVSNSSLALSLAKAVGGIALARSPVTDWLMESLGLVGLDFCDPFQGSSQFAITTRPGLRSTSGAERFKGWVLSEVHN